MAFQFAPISQLPPLALPPRQGSIPNFLCFPKLPKPTQSPPVTIRHSPPTNHNRLFTLLDGPVTSSTYASVLESCDCLDVGKQVHAHALKNGFHGHEFVETKLLQMYGSCGVIGDAALLFDKMPVRNLHSWTAILSVHLDNELFEEALSLIHELLFEDVELEFFVFPVALKICSGIGGIELGRQLHGFVNRHGFLWNIYVGNALIDMYGKCGSLDDAKAILNEMPKRDRVSWNSIVSACAASGMVYEALDILEEMSLENGLKPNLITWSAIIGGFSQNGYDEEAIEMLYHMQSAGFEPNARTLASVLPSCARLQKLGLGKEIHGYIIRHGFLSNPFVVNGLVDVYRRCANMESALKIFLKFSLKNVISFNTMIVGYCENGKIYKARELFDQMEVKGIKKDIISWNSMISGYVDNSMFDEAFNLFQNLLEEEEIIPDSFTLGSILTACADTCSLRPGKEMHCQAISRGLQSNQFVGGALVEMYSKCDGLRSAEMAFNDVNESDTATWNALISGYARGNQFEKVQNSLKQMKENGFEPNVYTWNGILAGYMENDHHESALQLFTEMLASNFEPDIFTIGIILPACTRLGTIERGKPVHALSIRHGYESDAFIGAALVDMYAKCGSIKHAQLTFDRIAIHNLVTQNAMLTAFAMYGRGIEGIAFFRRMQASGFRPDEVTFLSVLSCCVHAGSVEAGQELFNLLRYHEVRPTIKHYTCIVDLLSRAGQLNEAHKIIKKMPMEPDSVIWGALLGGCIIYNDIDLGEIAAERLIESEPDNTANYVMLANLYASAGRWCDLARTRQMIKDRHMHKTPGCSWIEDRDMIHVFVACDKSHKKAEEIYDILNNLTIQMRLEAGQHMCNTSIHVFNLDP